MSNDSVTVTSSQSWFSRVGSAITGVLVGFIFFIGSFFLLSWNEGRAIHREKTLDTGKKDVVSVEATPVDPANKGKLIHVTGDAAAAAPVSDAKFGVSAPVIRLQRNVEVFEWTETEKSESKTKVGGTEETTTTYTYKKEWSSQLVDSSKFQEKTGHENPTELPAETKTFDADDVTLGAFTLPPDLVEKIDNFTPLSLPEDQVLPTAFNAPVHRADEGFYVGADPKTPAVGDLRVKFEVAKPGPVSVIARQVAQTFEPYSYPQGEIELLTVGTSSAEAMFAAEAQANQILTWLLRLAGFVIMFIGLSLIAKPLSVIASFIPFLGDLLSAGTGLIAFALALPLTIVTIALAWVAYRPIIGIPLLVVAGAVIFFAARSLPSRKKATA